MFSTETVNNNCIICESFGNGAISRVPYKLAPFLLCNTSVNRRIIYNKNFACAILKLQKCILLSRLVG